MASQCGQIKQGPVGQAVRAAAALKGKVMATQDAVSCLPYTPEQINGFWVKDRQRSDRMAKLCDVMQLQGLTRQATKLVKGTRIRLSNESVDVITVFAIPGVKVAERYPLSGEEQKFRRRDGRRGGAWARLESTQEGAVIHSRWNAPLAGTGKETFKLVNPNELHIVTEMLVEGETCKYTQILTKGRK